MVEFLYKVKGWLVGIFGEELCVMCGRVTIDTCEICEVTVHEATATRPPYYCYIRHMMGDHDLGPELLEALPSEC